MTVIIIHFVQRDTFIISNSLWNCVLEISQIEFYKSKSKHKNGFNWIRLYGFIHAFVIHCQSEMDISQKS